MNKFKNKRDLKKIVLKLKLKLDSSDGSFEDEDNSVISIDFQNIVEMEKNAGQFSSKVKNHKLINIGIITDV